MKVNEILKAKNLSKKFKDNKGDTWEVVKVNIGENLTLILANGSRASITNLHQLDEILSLDFVEV